MRPARWQPVCPECAYRLRGCTGTRCPECGTPFPTGNRFFRRWAFQRLPWDRGRRDSLPGDYIRSLWTLLARPATASTGLTHPDRWARAVRWSLVHILITACGAALLSHKQYLIREAVELVREPPAPHPADSHYIVASPIRLLRWFTLSVSAWIVALTLIPALGALLSVGIPFRHRATRYGGVKLSLYLTAVVPVILAIGWLYHLSIHPLLMQLAIPGDVKLPSTLPSPLTKVSLSAACFAVWWAIGVSGNPFNRRRGWRPIVVNLGLFVAAWLLITRILFSVGRLGELL